MRAAIRPALAAVFVAGGLLSASPAHAAVTVFGGGLAQECSKDAHWVAMGLMANSQAIADCSLAIEAEPLGAHDLAGTYVNRGVLYLAKAAYADAKRDFDMAVHTSPLMGEAYVNRGAALIAMRKYAQGIAEIDEGLKYAPEEPEKAYFNRGLADEELNDQKSAYFDYMKAEELKPDWQQPKTELARFTVATRAKF